jgi:hypothetical protein
MKIPLFVRTYANGLKPFAFFALKIGKSRGWVNGFVDTGSPFTLVSQKDIQRLNIPLRQVCSSTPRSINLGGGVIYGYPVRGAQLHILDEKKTPVDISIPTLYLVQPIPNNKHSEEVARGIVTIIGMDLLMAHDLAIWFSPSQQSAYLEKV